MTDSPRHLDPDGAENKAIAGQQPGGKINPKVLLIIFAVLVVVGIVTLIVILQGS